MRTALITGAGGQDAAYLAHLLSKKNYRIIGLRHGSTERPWRFEKLGIADLVEIREAPGANADALQRLFAEEQVDEVYNLAGLSSVGESFARPLETFEANLASVVHLLEAIRTATRTIRLVHASSSEMFGPNDRPDLEDKAPLRPASPYAAAKSGAHLALQTYRRAYGVHASTAIMFNHESPLREGQFVTRKIVKGLVALSRGEGPALRLGNLAASRDWGFAGDYVEALWLMAQRSDPDDFVLATGEARSVREFADAVARRCGFDPDWRGQGETLEAWDRATGRPLITVDPAFYRPLDEGCLPGRADKAAQLLGWRPQTGFSALVDLLVAAEMADAPL